MALGLDDLERWAAGARAQEAADARVRERWLRQAAEEEASFAGLLVDLAEGGRTVVLTTTAGRRLQGPVVAVGWDFVALATARRRLTLVVVAAVAEVREAPGAPRRPAPARSPSVRPPSTSSLAIVSPFDEAPSEGGGGETGLGVTLAEVLAQAVAIRPRVSVVLGAVTVVGQLRAVGADVLSIRTDSEPAGLSYSRLSSVSEISLFDSG